VRQAQTMTEAGFIGHDDIGVRHAKTAPRQRIKWEIALMLAVNTGQPIDPERMDVEFLERRWQKLRRVDARVNRAVLIQAAEFKQYIFRAAVLVQPVM